MKRRLPGFLVLGGMKAGTTTLKHYLRQHPQIHFHHTEIHFFEKDELYVLGTEWYANHFTDAATGQIVGEKTPAYGYSAVAAARIAVELPDVKLVWILRNPVDRAYSNYWHVVNSGEELSSFEDAVHRELDEGLQPPGRAYCARSRYVDQIRTYLQHFPREQMCFLFLEELNADPASELGRLYRFLGVEPHMPKDMTIKHRTRIPKNTVVQHFLRRVVRRLFGRRVYRRIKRFNQRPQHGYPRMSDALRSRLLAHFAPYNEDLFALVGRKPRGWDA